MLQGVLLQVDGLSCPHTVVTQLFSEPSSRQHRLYATLTLAGKGSLGAVTGVRLSWQERSSDSNVMRWITVPSHHIKTVAKIPVVKCISQSHRTVSDKLTQLLRELASAITLSGDCSHVTLDRSIVQQLYSSVVLQELLLRLNVSI